MRTQNFVVLLMVLVLAACAVSAHAQSSDLIFIHTHGTQRVYTCQINTLRQWPTEAAMDDGLLAFNCSTPVIIGPSLQRSRIETPPNNVSDRLWTVTLVLAASQDVFQGCALLTLGMEQGSASISLQCPAALQ